MLLSIISETALGASIDIELSDEKLTESIATIKKNMKKKLCKSCSLTIENRGNH